MSSPPLEDEEKFSLAGLGKVSILIVNNNLDRCSNCPMNRVVNLKMCIDSTQESLESVVRSCDELMDGDGYNKSVSVASVEYVCYCLAYT